MTTYQLLTLYLLVGVGFGVAVMWRAPSPRLRAAPSAAAAVVVWPLWVPFALSSEASPSSEQVPLRHFHDPMAQRIVVALTALQTEASPRLVSVTELSAIENAAARALARQLALEGQLKERERERERLAGRSDAVALRHQATLDQMAEQQQREAQALTDLAEVLELMNAQLALANLTSPSSVDELKAELRDRVEALAELQPSNGPELTTPQVSPRPSSTDT